jgi:nucleotide-binding universal stress UspA family protein
LSPDSPVLICYDGSDDAARAIDVAGDLIVPTAAVVLAVAPLLTATESLVSVPVLPGAAAFHELNEADALERAQAGAERARRAGFRAKARGKVAASTADGIVEVAEELDAAVVVIGSRGLRWPQEFARGSVSHQVAEHARRPVLIVPPPRRADAARARGGPILICFDGSTSARRAIEAAAALLRARQAVVLEALPERVAVGYSATPSDAPWVDAGDGAAACAHAEAGAELARHVGLAATARVHSATTTWRAVTDVADEIDAPVIVTGSRGLTGVREAVEGSVSHDVATHVHRPVLIVPPHL